MGTASSDHHHKGDRDDWCRGDFRDDDHDDDWGRWNDNDHNDWGHWRARDKDDT